SGLGRVGSGGQGDRLEGEQEKRTHWEDEQRPVQRVTHREASFRRVRAPSTMVRDPGHIQLSRRKAPLDPPSPGVGIFLSPSGVKRGDGEFLEAESKGTRTTRAFASP